MRKSPGFVAVAVITLALGIGANTAIFTVVNAVFFNPIPVHDPKRLLSLFTTDQRNRGGLNNFLPVSYPNGEDIQHRAQSFSGVALEMFSTVSMTINGHPDTFNANLATGNYFRSEEHTSELQSHVNLVCRLLLEKKKKEDKA